MRLLPSRSVNSSLSNSKRPMIDEMSNPQFLAMVKEPPKEPVRKPKKRGRKRKRRIRKTSGPKPAHRAFYEVRLGYFIQHEAPLEYNIIMEVSGNSDPTPDLVEAIGYASLNPLFRKSKYRKALMEYREKGCHGRPKRSSVEIELLYAERRRRLKNM